MDLRAYLIQHDGHLSRTGKELNRLAKAADCSASHTYLCALGHKTPSRKLAERYHLKSRGRVIDPAAVLGLTRLRQVA